MKQKALVLGVALVAFICFGCTDADFSTHYAAIQIWNRTSFDGTCDVSIGSMCKVPEYYDSIKGVQVPRQDIVGINFTWIPGKIIVASPDTPPELINHFIVLCTVSIPDMNSTTLHKIAIQVTDNVFANVYVFESPLKITYPNSEFLDLVSNIINADDKALLYKTYAQNEETGEWNMKDEYNNLENFEYYKNTVLCPMLKTYNLDASKYVVPYLRYTNWDAFKKQTN